MKENDARRSFASFGSVAISEELQKKILKSSLTGDR
jgi:hypothetical protein